MVKAKAELGLTLKMSSGGGFNYFRPLIVLDDIDPEGDVPAQIEIGLSALKLAWSAVENRMTEIVETSELVEQEAVLVELRSRIAEIELRLDSNEGVGAIPAAEMTWTSPPKGGKKKK